MEKCIKDCLRAIEKTYPNNYEYGSKMRIFMDYIKEERTEEEIIIFTETLNKK